MNGGWARRMCLAGLSEVSDGTLTIRCPDRTHRFGTPGSLDAELTVRDDRFFRRALFDGDIGALRAAAQRAGVDLGIRGEVMDDTARMLGFDDCPGAAHAHSRAVLIPLHDGMSRRRRERIVATLDRLAAELE